MGVRVMDGELTVVTVLMHHSLLFCTQAKKLISLLCVIATVKSNKWI